jgi:hypothetical protein
MAIRADQPAIADAPSPELDRSRAIESHRFTPTGHGSDVERSLEQAAMKNRAADADRRDAGEGRFGVEMTIDEADPVERKHVIVAERDSEALQCRNAVGHEPFTAGLVDRRTRTVGDDHAESPQASGDGGG